MLLELQVIYGLCKLISMENADIWPQEEQAIAFAKEALHIMYVLITVPEFMDNFIDCFGPAR